MMSRPSRIVLACSHAAQPRGRRTLPTPTWAHTRSGPHPLGVDVISRTLVAPAAGATPPSRRVGRTIVVGTLVTLAAILLPITTVTAWAHRTVLDTSTYVDTIKPIASDPAVLAVASREATDQIFAALDVTAAITQ